MYKTKGGFHDRPYQRPDKMETMRRSNHYNGGNKLKG